METKRILDVTNKYCARNYKPLPIVLAEAEGVWVKDPEGNKYMDMLSSYSALNQGHRHPKIIEAAKNQMDKVTLTSRAFQNAVLGDFCQMLSELTGKEKILAMNTGAEAVETAIKCVRRWSYDVKGVEDNKAEIIVCNDNFHGRTVTAVSASSSPKYTRGFGPITPGIVKIPYGDTEALKNAINENTAAFMLEPIQGEAGVIMPPENFLKEAYNICKENNVLFVADEIQTGFGRTGKMFACDWEDVDPDLYIMGKALGGGVMPISAIAGSKDLIDLFEPGSHGSTFGGNPLACACAIAAVNVIKEENLVEKSQKMGEYMKSQLQKINNPELKEIRGKGLMIGVEIKSEARPFCEKLMEEGILCKETHENVIRFAPPLVITKEEMDWAIERVLKVMNN